MHDQFTKWWTGVSLRTRITGVTVLLVTIGLLVAGIGTMTVLRTYLLDEVDRRIGSTALSLGDIAPPWEATCQRLAGPNSFFVAILDSDGSQFCNNRSSSAPQPVVGDLPVDEVVSLQSKPFSLWDKAHETQWRVVAVPYQTGDLSQSVSVVVGLNLADTNGIIARYTAIFLGFGLSVVVLGAALTRLLVTSTFVPLREVEAHRRGHRRRRLQPTAARRDPEHRGRPPQSLPQHHAQPDRPRLCRSREDHRSDASLRRRREP